MRHWLNIYQRPKQGEQPLIRLPAHSYRHKIASVGWFDTASCRVHLERADVQWAFDNWIGGGVQVFVDNPHEPIWEGYINRLTYNMGALSYTMSLDEMANRVAAVYSAPDVSTTMVQQSPQIDIPESQDLFGIKEGGLEGLLIEGSNVTIFSALVNTQALIRAFPKKSTVASVNPNDINVMTIECKGWYDTLNWCTYFNTNTTVANPDVQITNALASYPNGDLFFSNTAVSQVEANTGFSRSREVRSGISYWQYFQSLQEAGDGSNAWVMGILPSVYGSNYRRRFYYRPASTEPKYQVRAQHGRILNLYGAEVPPYEATPNGGAIISDLLGVARYGFGENPNEFYIDGVEYDGDSQQVRFSSTDNTGVEGLYQFNRHYKLRGKRFGAGPRTAYV